MMLDKASEQSKRAAKKFEEKIRLMKTIVAQKVNDATKEGLYSVTLYIDDLYKRPSSLSNSDHRPIDMSDCEVCLTVLTDWLIGLEYDITTSKEEIKISWLS